MAPIVIAVVTRMDKPQGSFITPMIHAFNDDTDNGTLSAKWKVLSFLSRKDTGSDAQEGVRNAMLKGPDSTYEWEAIICFVDKEKETARDIGMNLAQEFSSFSKNDRVVRVHVIYQLHSYVLSL